MERLTTRNIAGVAVYKNPFECEKCGDTIWRLPDYGNGSPTEKLADYEDAEEQGLLLRLPCKVGDILYYPEGCFNIVIPVRLNEIVMSFVGLDTYSFQYNCCSFDECGDVYEEYEFDKCDILTKLYSSRKLKPSRS